jgi:hypothetical protein
VYPCTRTTSLNVCQCWCSSFAELAQLLDAGKAVRTDKLSIIADAVKEVTKLRAESHQLRQLNKFLEVGPAWTLHA